MNRQGFIEDLKAIVGLAHVSTGSSHAEIYSYDASLARGRPDVIVFPANTQETAAVVRRAKQVGMPLVSSPITPFKGTNTISPFIKLESRTA